MHDPDRFEVFPELAALQVQEKFLRLAQFGRMNSEHEIASIGKPSKHIQINGDMLSMLFHHTFERSQPNDPGCWILLRPLLIKRENGERAVDPRISEKLLPIHCRPSVRYPWTGDQPDKQQSSHE
jgi:hypothetical protein